MCCLFVKINTQFFFSISNQVKNVNEKKNWCWTLSKKSNFFNFNFTEAKFFHNFFGTWQFNFVQQYLGQILPTLENWSFTYIYSRNKKIRIWKMGKNSAPLAKLDPLTTNIIWIYNLSSLDIIKFLAYCLS